jgi:hypothetical protein
MPEVLDTKFIPLSHSQEHSLLVFAKSIVSDFEIREQFGRAHAPDCFTF